MLDFTIMGIVNVTPDSFSDGGRFFDLPSAVERALTLEADGAQILDVGGESTRPGADPVEAQEESRRVVPVDTSKADVTERALAAGATIVNDVTALRAAPEMAELTARAGADLCLMHMVGTPRTMQDNPEYEDVVSEVKRFLEERMRFATDHGVPEERIILDPGFGFGKTVAHNLELLNRLPELLALGRPLMVGTSRKSFLGTLTGRSTDHRVAATLATNVIAYERGARMFRVHDVGPLHDALTVTAATLAS
jgi:dihydropteroate synthase